MFLMCSHVLLRFKKCPFSKMSIFQKAHFVQKSLFVQNLLNLDKSLILYLLFVTIIVLYIIIYKNL